LLLHHHADVSIANRNGETAGSVAKDGCKRIDWVAFEQAQKITPDNLWTVIGKEKKKNIPNVNVDYTTPTNNRAITILGDEMKNDLATIEKKLEMLMLQECISKDRRVPSPTKEKNVVKDDKKNDDDDNRDEDYQLIDCA
jgi:hypothetical protein